MGVEYAGVVAALSLFAATLAGVYGQNVSAVFTSGSVGVAAVGKAARTQGVPRPGARQAYQRAPYTRPALRYLYAIGWIGGMKERARCGFTLLAQDTATAQTVRQIRSTPRLMNQLRRHRIGAPAAARAVVRGVVSACD